MRAGIKAQYLGLLHIRQAIIDYSNLCAECGLSEPSHDRPRWQFWHKQLDHDYERGCYCAESGRCEVCVDAAIDYADHLRDVAKEDGIAF